jgi:hypothetical protein
MPFCGVKRTIELTIHLPVIKRAFVRAQKNTAGKPAVQVRQGGMKLDRRSRRRGGEPTFLLANLARRREETVNQKR